MKRVFLITDGSMQILTLTTYIRVIGENGFFSISGTSSTCNNLGQRGNITYYINNNKKNKKICRRYMLDRENTLITQNGELLPLLGVGGDRRQNAKYLVVDPLSYGAQISKRRSSLPLKFSARFYSLSQDGTLKNFW